MFYEWGKNMVLVSTKMICIANFKADSKDEKIVDEYGLEETPFQKYKLCNEILSFILDI